MPNNRRKGADGEREAAKLWQRWFPNARRSYGQSRYGYEQPDIIGCKPFYIEVKRTKTEPSETQKRKWWAKLMSDWAEFEKLNGEEDGYEPILMWRKDKGEWEVAYYYPPNLGHITHITDWETFTTCMDIHYPVINP